MKLRLLILAAGLLMWACGQEEHSTDLRQQARSEPAAETGSERAHAELPDCLGVCGNGEQSFI